MVRTTSSIAAAKMAGTFDPGRGCFDACMMTRHMSGVGDEEAVGKNS